LAEVDDEVYLFLDDFHCVSNAKIYEGLAFLLKNAPANFHVVLSSRTEPSLPLASLRVHNHLLELDATDLRFDPRGNAEPNRAGASRHIDRL
jgi:LuxR family transcriptional regulator, maltose regulon positive regulatory protein